MRDIKNVVVILTTTAMLLLTSCTDLTKKPPGQTIEGNLQILWDSSAGLSPDLYAVNALWEQFPDAQFHHTEFMRREYSQSGSLAATYIYDIAEKDVPGDLIMFESTLAPYLFKSGYLEPLDNYLDMSSNISGHLNGELMDIVREQGDGPLFGIPFGKNVYALYYNADIFNELEIPAPSDGMTWDEVFSLAKKINEHPLRGNRAALRVPDKNLVYSQFDIRILNSDGAPDEESERWERARQLFDEMSELELSEQDKLNKSASPNTTSAQFYDGLLAMYTGCYLGDNSSMRNGATRGLSAPFANWNISSFPVLADAPGTGPAPSYYYLGIPKNSTRKTEAFQLISYLLSDEPQMDNSRNGLASALGKPEINSRFGESVAQLGGKNTQAFFRYSKEGTLDPEYDWDMQDFGVIVYMKEAQPLLNELLEYKRRQLEKVGVVRE